MEKKSEGTNDSDFITNQAGDLTGVKKLKIVADSLAKANEQLKSKIPDGYRVLEVKTMRSGASKSVTATDYYSVDAALEKARGDVPPDAITLEEKVVHYPRTESFQVKAFTTLSIHIQDEMRTRGFDGAFRFKGTKLIQEGSKGFLGIGKKPNTYEVEVYQQPAVEIIYNETAEIVASIITTEKYIEKLITDLGNSEFYWGLNAEPDDSWEVEITDEGKSIREKASRSLISLGIVAVPQLCKALADSRRLKIPSGPSYVYPSSYSSFKEHGPDTKDGEEVGRIIATTLLEIGNRDHVQQHVESLKGIARIRALWVLSKLGDLSACEMLCGLPWENDKRSEAFYYFDSNLKLLRDALNDPSAGDKSVQIGEIVVERLTKVMKEPKGKDRQWQWEYAAEMVGRIGKQRAVKPLLAFLVSCPNADAVRAAIYALSELKDPRATAPLITLVKSAESVDVRETAVRVLRHFGGAEVIDALKEAASHDKDRHVRWQAKGSLHELGVGPDPGMFY